MSPSFFLFLRFVPFPLFPCGFFFFPPPCTSSHRIEESLVAVFFSFKLFFLLPGTFLRVRFFFLKVYSRTVHMGFPLFFCPLQLIWTRFAETFFFIAIPGLTSSWVPFFDRQTWKSVPMCRQFFPLMWLSFSSFPLPDLGFLFSHRLRVDKAFPLLHDSWFFKTSFVLWVPPSPFCFFFFGSQFFFSW